MSIRLFDLEMPTAQVFKCVCPHCGHERLAVDNGRQIQARFTKSAVQDSATVRCTVCGGTFERRDGLKQIATFQFGSPDVRMAV